MNDFQIGLVASLDDSKSKQQLNKDIDNLKSQLSTLEVQAKLDKNVVSDLTRQLSAVQVSLQNVKIDQATINKMISQINSAISGININLGQNINSSGAIQSAQKTGQQIGNQIGSSINQSLQSKLNYVKQNIQSLFNTFSNQKLNSVDLSKMFNLNRASIDSSVMKEVQSLTKDINSLATEALKLNTDSSWEGVVNKINTLSATLTKFGSTRDLSGFKEALDVLNYFDGKKVFISDKSELLQNTGMSIRELNNQFRNLGVTFTTVANNSTNLDTIWSELFSINPNFQQFTTFGDQINTVVNELKIAKEALYGEKNLTPVNGNEVTSYLNSWLESLTKLSERVETLKTEQIDIQNQIAQASNNATNIVVANQQKQQQAYQQTANVVQAITSDESIIKSGVGARTFSDVDEAKSYFSQLLNAEQAVIATTERFGENNGLTSFTVNVKRATGEVESLRYAVESIKDDRGNVIDTFYRPSNSQINDSGAIKQIQAIENAFSDYSTRLAKFKSTNSEILSGLDTPLKEFESKLSGLKTGASTINEVKASFNSLNSEAAKITQNFSKQLSPIDRAVAKITQGDEAIKSLTADFKGLDNAPKEINKELTTCVSLLQRVKDIESKEGRTENWSKAYKDWSNTIDSVSAKLATLKKEQANSASTQIFNTSDLKANNIAYMSKVYNTIEKQMVEINKLARSNNWSDVKVSGIEQADGKIQQLTLTVRDAEGALKQFNMQREKLQGNGKAQAGLVQSGDVKVLETATQYAEKLANIKFSIGDNGNTTTAITTLENNFTKLGLSTDEVRQKMEAVKSEYATLQSLISGGASGSEISAQFEKVNTVLTQTQNDLKATRSEYSLLASDFSRLSLANDIEEWNQKNTAATSEVIAQNQKYIESLRDLDTAMTQVSKNNIATSFKQTENSMRTLGKLGASVTDQFKQAIDSFKVWVSATTLVMGAVNLIRQVPTAVNELDTALVDLKKTTTMTNDELKEFYEESPEIAKEMGVTTKAIIEQASAWSRLGFSTKDSATKMAKYSAMFKTISPGMDLEQATDGLVSVMKAFKIGEDNVDDVVDGIMSKINIVGNTQAVENSDIVDFLTRSSSAMAEANNTLEQTIALGTAATEITRSADSVGNALKTISMRIRGYDEDTESYTNDVEQLSGVIADLTKTADTPGGISLFTDDTKQTYKSTYELLKEISQIYDQLSDKNQAKLLEALAGKRQGQIVAAMLSNFSAAEKSMDSMANSAGNAEEEMSVAMDSIDYKANRLKETGTAIAQNLLSQNDAKTILDTATKIAEAFDFMTSKLDLFKTAMLGISAYGSIKGIGIFDTINDSDNVAGQKLVTSLTARKVAQEEATRQLEIDIQCLREYETECQKGNVSTEMFAKTMQSASVEAQKYATNIKEGTGSAEMFEANQKAMQTSLDATTISSKAAAVGMTIFKTVLNSIAVFAVIEGIQLLVKGLDSLVLTIDEANEARQSANTDLEEAQSNLDSINTELDTTSQKIDELKSKGSLSFVEQGELEKLEQQNKLLQIQADTAERIAQAKQSDLISTDETNYNKLFKDKSVDDYYNGYKNSGFAYDEKEDSPLVLMAQLKKAQEDYQEVLSKKSDYENQYSSDGIKYWEDDVQSADDLVNKLGEDLDKQMPTLLNMQSDLSSVDYSSLTASQQAMLDNLNDMVKTYYQIRDAGKYNEISVQDIFDTKDIEVTKEDLIELAQAGKLDENTLNQYPKLTKAIKDADLITKDGKTDVEAFVEAIKAMGDEAENTGNKVSESLDQNSISNMITSLDKLQTNMKDLDSIMADFVSGDGVDVSNLSGIVDTFKELEEAGKDIDMSSVESAIQQISDASSLSEAQSALDSLCNQYVKASGILDDLSDSNKELVSARLKAIGVANADEIVEQQLEAQKLATKVATEGLTASTVEEIQKLLDEGNYSEEAKQGLYQLLLTKIDINNNPISTASDIEQLIALANAAGASYAQLKSLQTLLSLMSSATPKAYTKSYNDTNSAIQEKLGTRGYRESSTTDLTQYVNEQATKIMSNMKNSWTNLNASSYIKTPKYGGGSSTKSAQNKANKSSGSGNKGSGSSKSEPTEKDYDWIETLISRIERNITNLGKTVSATYKTWSTRNNALAQELSAVNGEISTQQAAYNKYMQLADSVGLSENYASLVRNGTLDVSTIADDDLNDKISKYKEYYEAALDCADTIQDLNDKIAELAKSKFDNINSEYEEQLKLIDHASTMYQGLLDNAENLGYVSSQKYYEALINTENSNISKLQSQYNSLINARNEALSSGKIAQNSEDWYSMTEAINSVEEALQDANKSLIEYKNNMRQVQWDFFDKQEDYVGKLQDESDWIIDLISAQDKLYDSDTGKITNSGKTVEGLHAVNYNAYMAQADDYAKEIKKLDSEIANDPANTTLIERRQELLELQREMISSVNDEKDAIKDLASDGFNALSDALKKIADNYLDILDSQKDLYDYQNTIQEKTDNIASLRKQLSALQGDTSEETQSKIQQLQDSLKTAEKDLKDSEWDRYISDTKQMIQNLEDDVTEWINARLDDIDGLIQSVIDQTNTSTGEIKDTISTETGKVGYTITDPLNKILTADSNNGTAMVSFYDTKFPNEMNTTRKSIDAIKDLLQKMKDAADKKAQEEIAKQKAAQQKVSNPSSTPSSSSKPASTSSSNSSSSSSGGGVNFWVYRKDSYPKSKLQVDTSVVDRLKKFDIASDFANRRNYYQAMGLGSASSYRGTASQNRAMISWMRSKGYAKGTKSATKGLHLVGEDASEIGIAQGRLVDFSGGETVFNGDMTKKLWDFANNPANFMSDLVPKLPNIKSTSANSSFDVGGVNIVMNGVNDVESFGKELRSALANDTRTQKMLKTFIYKDGNEYLKWK